MESKSVPSGNYHLTLPLICQIVSINRSDEFFASTKIGVSLSIHTSAANWFMGANRWTVFPSSNITNLPHGISSLVHLKPFRNMFSALSAATQPFVSLADFENVWNIFLVVAVETFCHS